MSAVSATLSLCLRLCLCLSILPGCWCGRRNELCGHEDLQSPPVARWLNMESQKFSTLGTWECLWDSQHRYLSARSPQCDAKTTWWSSILNSRKAPGKSKIEFDRNRHNFFQWQQARFSRSHYSTKCAEGMESVAGDRYVHQIYTKSPWDPVEIPCLKCDRDKVMKGLGQKFYTGGVLRDIFKTPKDLFKQFYEVHYYQTLLASKSPERNRIVRSPGMGEQLENGNLLLTGGPLYPTYGTYFCTSDDDQLPDIFVNVDTLMTDADLQVEKFRIDPITGQKVFQVINDAEWRQSHTDLNLLKWKFSNDSFKPFNDTKSNLQVLIYWHKWSCCSGCVFNKILNPKQKPYRRRHGYVVIRKMWPNRPIKLAGISDLLDKYLSIRPYNVEGIPFASTLLRSMPADRQLINDNFQQLRQTPLGYFYETSGEKDQICKAVPLDGLEKCYEELEKCRNLHDGHVAKRFSPPPPPTLHPWVTQPQTTQFRFFPDSGSGHVNITVNYLGPAKITIKTGKSYWIRCDWGSNVFRSQVITWRKGEIFVKPFDYKRAVSEQQQFVVEGAVMHIHKAERHHEGKYSCGKGEIHRLYVVLVYDSHMEGFLIWTGVIAALLALAFAFWLFIHILYAPPADEIKAVRIRVEDETEEGQQEETKTEPNEDEDKPEDEDKTEETEDED